MTGENSAPAHGKRNRAALRKLMGSHDISSERVALILQCKVSTVHQYRSKSGADISDFALFYLAAVLGERVWRGVSLKNK